jgi:hypothetical protein
MASQATNDKATLNQASAIVLLHETEIHEAASLVVETAVNRHRVATRLETARPAVVKDPPVIHRDVTLESEALRVVIRHVMVHRVAMRVLTVIHRVAIHRLVMTLDENRHHVEDTAKSVRAAAAAVVPVVPLHPSAIATRHREMKSRIVSASDRFRSNGLAGIYINRCTWLEMTRERERENRRL